MARICPLFSSSSGNSTLIREDGFSVLVDAGASFRSLCAAAQAIDENITDISAVFITHEHSDHISGLSALLKKTGVPLFASEKTLSALTLKGVIPNGTKTVVADGEFAVGDFLVTRFATSHDCDGSSGYTFVLPSRKKISVCTDLGVVTDEVRSALKGSDCMLFESNHDIDMLNRGPYPPQLKLRILSEKGHLSNNACAAELVNFLQSGTTRFILGHLSRHNNLPMLALSAARGAFADIGAAQNKDYILNIAKPQDNGVTAL